MRSMKPRWLTMVTLWSPVLLLIGLWVAWPLLATTYRRPEWSYYVAAVLVVSVFVLLLIWMPKRQVASLRQLNESPAHLIQVADIENKNRATLAQILGGAFVLFGLFFTWQTVRSTWDSVDLARQGQITERFARAIELLGSEKFEVRLGGIYALERIARDSERDHWPVMEVLTAYVRENSPWSDARDVPSQSVPLATDIQAVLTVLNRRTREWDKGRTLDLQRTDLRRAHLVGAHLEEANLFAAHLEGAMLKGAHLEKADLSAARLQGARLSQAHLEGAILMSANLDSTNLVDAHLEGASLQGASLKGADLRGADLRGVYLRLTRGLTRAQIESAQIDEHTIWPDYLKEGGEGPPQEAAGGEAS